MSGGEPAAKRRKTKGNIKNFFGPPSDKKRDFDAARKVLMTSRESTREEDEDEMDVEGDDADEFGAPPIDDDLEERPTTPTPEKDVYISNTPPSAQPQTNRTFEPLDTHDEGDTDPPEPPKVEERTVDMYTCVKCNVQIPTSEKTEHEDYHFALDLSKEMRATERAVPNMVQATRNTPVAPKPSRGRGRPPGAGRGVEKGQAKLAFGRQS